MARSLTADWLGHDLLPFRPRAVVSSTEWQDVCAGLNLALGVCGAHQIVHDGWADEQAFSDTADWERQFEYMLPPRPSPQHDTIKVVIHARSDDAGAGIRVRERKKGEAGGAWTALVPGAVTSALTATVDSLADDTGGDLHIEVTGEVEIYAVDAWIPPWLPGGWPGAGEHDEGQISDSVDIVPAELEHFATDYPATAGQHTDLREAVGHIRGRPRVYFSACAPLLATDPYIRRPIRAIAPALFGTSSLTAKFDAVGGANAGNVYIQHGRGEARDIVSRRRSPHVETFDIAAAAALATYSRTTVLRDEVVVDGPIRYPGLGHLALWATPDVSVRRVALWGT